jgi:hypothetical protein
MKARKVYTNSELEDLIEKWHTSHDVACSLYSYLGWTREEYENWLETNRQPGELTLRDKLKLHRKRLVKR